MGTSAYNIHYFSSVHKVVHQKVHKVVVRKVVYQAFGLNIWLFHQKNNCISNSKYLFAMTHYAFYAL